MADIITEYVYYWPPAQMTPSSVVGLNSDEIGMIIVDFAVYNNVASQIESGATTLFGGTAVGLNQYTITITPQAFVGWYQQNLSTIKTLKDYSLIQNIYQFLTSPYQGLQSELAYVDFYLSNEGYYWKPYSQAQNGIASGTLALSSSVLDPTKDGLTSNNLYALIKAIASGSAVSGGINPSAGITQPTVSTTPLTIAQNTQIANTTAQANSTVQNDITLTPSQLSEGVAGTQANSTITKTVETVTTTVNKALSQSEIPILIGLGLIAVAAIAIAVVVVD